MFSISKAIEQLEHNDQVVGGLICQCSPTVGTDARFVRKVWTPLMIGAVLDAVVEGQDVAGWVESIQEGGAAAVAVVKCIRPGHGAKVSRV